MKIPYDISNSDIDRLINEWIRKDRDRKILHDREINGMIFEELAEKYDLSVQAIKRIVYHGQSVIFSHLKDRY